MWRMMGKGRVVWSRMAIHLLSHTPVSKASHPHHQLINTMWPLGHRKSELISALHHALPKDIPLAYGKNLKAIHEDGHRIHVEFEDGSTDSGNVLVGADGMFSRWSGLVDISHLFAMLQLTVFLRCVRVRSLVAPTNESPRYRGYGVYRGVVPSVVSKWNDMVAVPSS